MTLTLSFMKKTKDGLMVESTLRTVLGNFVKIQSVRATKNKVIRFDAVVTDGILAGKRIKVSILKDTIQMRHKSLVLNSGISFRSELKHFDNFHNTDFDYGEYMLGLYRNTAFFEFFCHEKSSVLC